MNRVCRLRFGRIIPCHFANDLRAGPREFAAAFAFVNAPGEQSAAADDAAEGDARALPMRASRWLPRRLLSRRRRGVEGPRPTEGDLALLAAASDVLVRLGVTPPPKLKGQWELYER